MSQGVSTTRTMKRHPTHRLGQLWPLSVITMAFTVLSQLEATQSISIYVSYAVSIWKDLLAHFYEGLINFILRLINIPPIDLSSPWPETLFIITMMLFCFLHGDKIRNFSLSRKISSLHIKAVKKITAMNPESWRAFTATLLLALLQHIPTYLILFALFGPTYLTLVLCVTALALTFASGWFTLKAYANKSDVGPYVKAHSTFIMTLNYLITFFAVLILLLAVALEAAAPHIQEFIQNANQHYSLTQP